MDLRESLQRTLGDPFRIERELGGGGMSRVFLATDVTLNRPVVVKVLSAEASSGVSAERFRREIQLIAQLQHPHVVPLLSAGAADGALFYVMPYLGGEALRARLSREGPMAVADSVKILREVLDALSFAHAHGVIHRDIKPENILLEAGHAVVADFGIAKALSESSGLTSVGVSLGTPAYMAPEQASADPTADHRVDLYAVGVVAYEMLTGAPPFAGTPQQVLKGHLVDTPTPLRHRRSDVPEPLANLVMNALEKDAVRRPQSAAEMVAALDSLATPIGMTGRSDEAAPDAPGDSTSGLSRVRPRRWLVIGAIAAVAALSAFVAWRSAGPRVSASAQSIAISPFAVADGDTALVRLGQNLVTTLSANLDGVGQIHIVDAMAVLSNARTKGALLSVADAIEISRTLGARSAIHGTLVRSGGLVRADAALYDVAASGETAARPLARMSATAAPDSLAALTDSLTWGLLRLIWKRGDPPTPNVSSITTHSPVALREFLEGERLFSRGAFDEAAAAYGRAVAADTTFWFAALRYWLSGSWQLVSISDTTIIARMFRHRAELPERERSLLSVGDSAPTRTEVVSRLERLTGRYRDYAPAWQLLADVLVHEAELAGQDARDAIGPSKQLVRLMPADMESANHLAFACISVGDRACARQAFTHFDSLIRADPSPMQHEVFLQRYLRLAVGLPSPGLLDSLLREAKRDSIKPVPTRLFSLTLAPALVDQPRLFQQLDELGVGAEPRGFPAVFGMTAAEIEIDRLVSRALRGSWTSLDSAQKKRGNAVGAREIGVDRLEIVRGRVLAELQGAIVPRPETSSDALEYATLPQASAQDRIEVHWIAATNALVRHDTSVFRVQLAEVSSDTTRLGRISARSLRAIATGLSGDRQAAGESLLVIEREHGQRTVASGPFAADRLLASQWLFENKKYAAADSLLRFTQGYITTSSIRAAWPVFAAAQLQRSRIAEALGNRDEAIRFATIFVRAYDLAPPEHKSQIEEAKQRIARLGGTLDAPKTQRVP